MSFKNKDREKEYKHDWYVENKEHCLQQSKEYAKDHPEEVKNTATRWKLNHPGEYPKAQRKSHLKRTYNLSLDEYTQMLNKQDGKCSICKMDITENGKAYVDHDHMTNKVRELLCMRCNSALGMIKENVATLSNMAMYLLKYKIGLEET